MSRLYDALRRAEAERERIRKGGPEVPSIPAVPATQRGPWARPLERSVRGQARPGSAPHLATFARGLAIFASGAALALVAVQLTPRPRPTARPETQPALAIPPATLKLDYRLDLTRTGGAAR